VQIHIDINFITGGTTAANSSKGQYQLKLDSLVEFDMTKIEVHRSSHEFEAALKSQMPSDAKVALVVDAPTSSMKIVVD